jgi:hypothetical protein
MAEDNKLRARWSVNERKVGVAGLGYCTALKEEIDNTLDFVYLEK